jgi:predicted DNA-binding protein YlxM (UPF0122 family)
MIPVELWGRHSSGGRPLSCLSCPWHTRPGLAMMANRSAGRHQVSCSGSHEQNGLRGHRQNVIRSSILNHLRLCPEWYESFDHKIQLRQTGKWMRHRQQLAAALGKRIESDYVHWQTKANTWSIAANISKLHHSPPHSELFASQVTIQLAQEITDDRPCLCR